MDRYKFATAFLQAVELFKKCENKCCSHAERCVRQVGLPAVGRHKIVWAVMLAAAYTDKEVDYQALAEQAYENVQSRTGQLLMRLKSWHANLADNHEPLPVPKERGAALHMKTEQ